MIHHLKTVFILFLISTLILTIPVKPINVTEQTVSTLSTTLYVGGNGQGNYTSIQNAINDARNGDTIFVYDESSPYHENIIVDKSIQLLGENKETTIVDGSTTQYIVHISANHVNISGFYFRSISSSGNNIGIKINSDQNIIQENIFNNVHTAISLESTRETTITKNRITTTTYGIHISDSSHNYFFDNNIASTTTGIYITTGAQNNLFYVNTIQNNNQGIHIEGTTYNDIGLNTITNNYHGIYFSHASHNHVYDGNLIAHNHFGIYFSDTTQTNVYNDNHITNNKYGILLSDSSEIDISENIIYENTIGITLNTSSHNDVYWNEITKNINGIDCYRSTDNNIYLNSIEGNHRIGVNIILSRQCKIAYNNFISNYIHSYFEQDLLSFNIWKRNYWDDWRGGGPQIIDGILFGPFRQRLWTIYDYRPTNSPYDIS